MKTRIQNITNYHLDYRGKPDNGTSALLVLPVDGSERKYEINLICGTEKETTTTTTKKCEDNGGECVTRSKCVDENLLNDFKCEEGKNCCKKQLIQ